MSEMESMVCKGILRKYLPYPAYKDSGIEWLGEVPEGWEVKPIKRVASYNDEALPETTDPDFEIEYVDISGVDEIDGIRTTQIFRFENAPSRARRRVQDGDIIVSTVRTYLKAIAGVHNPPENMIVSTGFCVIRPCVNLGTGFARYLFKANYLINEIVASSVGVSYPAINASDLGAIKVALPFLEEQRAIAAFLDSETSLIDAIIEKKQRQVELLQEKRTALISRAVTKGLNPDVKMKYSGIEWLGEVPEDWEVARLRFRLEINPSRSEINGLPSDFQVSFVPMEAVCEQGGLRLDQTKPLDEVSTGYTYFREGDIVVAKITPCFENSKGSIAEGLENGIGFGTTELHVLRPSAQLDRRFLFYLTISHAFRRIGMAYMYGAGGQKRVPDGFVRNFRHPIPPVEEQCSIAAFLDRETTHIDALTEKIGISIDLLREYRTALVSAAVTGKIYVRGKPYITGVLVRALRGTRTVDVMPPLQKQSELIRKAVFSPVLELSAQLEQAQQVIMPFKSTVDLTLKMSECIWQHQEFMSSIAGISKTPKHVAHIAQASQSWFDLIERAHLHTEAFKRIGHLHSSWQQTIGPLKDVLTSRREATMLLMETVARNMVATERLLASVDFERLNKRFTLPEMTISQFHNAIASLSENYGSLANSISNVPDLVEIPKLILPGASRELLINSYAISTLDVEVQTVVEVGDMITEEEKGIADLSSLLEGIDPALPKLYMGAKEALAGGGTDHVRHVLVSLRELTTQILHRLAPDENVHKWIPLDKEGNYLHDGKPTRKARLHFICRGIMSEPLTRFVQKDSEVVSSLFDVFNHIHEVEPSMTDKQLKALVLRIGSWAQYIIGISEESGG